MKFKFDSANFSKEVKTKRVIEENIGVVALGEKIGTSGATISRVENGHTPEIDTYAKLCFWLKKPMNVFINVKMDK
jgi:transcriptional regulator with XRE-family HTH domain